MQARKLFILAALACGTNAAAAPVKPDAARAPAATSLSEATAAVQAVDPERLLSDPDYARVTMGHLNVVRASNPQDLNLRLGLDMLRIIAFAGQQQHKEAAAAAAELVKTRPDVPQIYPIAVFAAAAAEQPEQAVATMESAARNVTDSAALAELRDAIPDDVVNSLFHDLGASSNESGRQRLSEALLVLGWPHPDDASYRDTLRLNAIDARLEKPDLEGARRLASEITEPRSLLTILAARRYDPVAGGGDPHARLNSAIAAFDRSTARLMEQKKGDHRRILERAQFLRGLDREEEAAALLLPYANDMAAVHKAADEGGEDLFWIVNEAAYALVATGRGGEAVSLMEKLLQPGLEKYPGLISMAINHGEILNSLGRYKEAAAYAERLAKEAEGPATPYGHMWIWETAACAHTMAGNRAAAEPWLRRVVSGSKDNEAAHMRTLICLDRMDEAERLLVKRLEGDDGPDVLVKMQDYQLGRSRAGREPALQQRWDALRERPAVKAAIAKVGRILTVPLSQTYWGGF